MSLTSDRIDHHLTEKGWVLGTERIDFVLQTVPVPDDCVMTVQEHIYRASYQDDEEISFKETFLSSDVARLERLTALHGKLPETLGPFKVPRWKKADRK